MVKALHRAGIEVILDVVYNHTAEGNHLGPDARASRASTTPRYYRLMPDDPRYYMDFTGTGNSLNPVHPSVLRLIMDSLRYFVIDCHVDGFRFDLASALAREFYDVDRLSAFFDIDPPGPGPLAGEADRRAVGRRRRAATRSATSRSSGPSGTASTATRCATSGAAQATVARVRAALHRLERPVPARRPPAVRVDQLRHRPRRLHARRPRLLQREAQRGERRGQPRRHATTTAPGTAASRARPTTRRSTRCASGSSATS